MIKQIGLGFLIYSIFLAAWALPVWAQGDADFTAVFKNLPSQAKSVEAYVPGGWKIIRQSHSAGKQIFALELGQMNSEDNAPSQTRALVVLFREHEYAPYRYLGCNWRLFVSGEDMPTEHGIDFVGEMMELRLTVSGRWSVGITTYRFRYAAAKRRLQLVAAEFYSGGAEPDSIYSGKRVFVDFLSGTVEKDIESDTKPAATVLSRKFAIRELFFDDLTTPGFNAFMLAIDKLLQENRTEAGRSASGVDSKQFPKKGSVVDDFVPAKWRIEQQALSASEEFLALKLRQREVAGEEASAPDVLVLLRHSQKSEPYVRIGLNVQMLGRSMGPQGYCNLAYKGDILVVQNSVSGSNRSWEIATQKFRYQPEACRLRLIGEDLRIGSYEDGEDSYSINLLTGKIHKTHQSYEEVVAAKPLPAIRPAMIRQHPFAPIYFEDVLPPMENLWERVVVKAYQNSKNTH